MPYERGETVERIIKRVNFPIPVQPKAVRVAAYARVSTGKDAMLHSLSAQVSYYSEMIQHHGNWQYCGVYSDEAFTGTKEDRPGFQELMVQCRAGNIDMVITKSISRLSRNTITLLNTTRELKSLGVDVYFEEQNIHTMSADGELMMTILASFAQEESRSASENMKWRVKRNFENGEPWHCIMLGYRIEDGQYVIIPEEAKIVRRVFEDYLGGKGMTLIAKELNEEGILTRKGNTWTPCTIKLLLRNYAYTGNLLLQKTYRENHITKKKMKNHGEQPMYHAEETHDSTVDLDTFLAVQKEMASRAEHYNAPVGGTKNRYPFSNKLICDGCGKHYRRKKTAARVVWICKTFNTFGKEYCPTSKQIPEETLMEISTQVLGTDTFDEAVFSRQIKEVRIGSNNVLKFVFLDGSVTETVWADRSRAESWTAERKLAARHRELQRRA